MKLQEVDKLAALTFRLTSQARRFDPKEPTWDRLCDLDNVMSEVQHFATMFDQARVEKDAEAANRIRGEAMARWVAFITAEQGS